MNPKNFSKILVIGFMILLLGASVSAYTVKNNNSTPTRFSWSDDFSAYTLGQFLDGDPTDGGWKGWDNDPTWGAFVVDTQELSVPHSVEVVADVDLVREFAGLTTGTYTFTAWQYIPGNLVGNTYFILLSDYQDGAGQNNLWAVQMRFDADQGLVESEYDGITLWLVYDQWVEIRCEIDLDNDWVDMYYDGALLHGKNWTATPNNDGSGILNIAAIDLFANRATEVYYDDISLEGEGVDPIPDLDCSGTLAFTDITPSSAVTGTFTVSNVGEVGSLLDWEVSSWPTWGTGWTFTPTSGVGLPDGNSETVTVDFTAPPDAQTDFTGTITVINSASPTDSCDIAITLSTPRAHGFPLFQKILEKYPNAFPLLRALLEI
jgi:hypothetical protein